MGQLVDGVWTDDTKVATLKDNGRWTRTPSIVRHRIQQGTQFPPEPGRYHLYAAWNCPWAHRALITRKLLGLESVIPVSFVAPKRTDQGWVFAPEDGYEDALFRSSALHQVYTRGAADYTGRVTVPLLYDTHTDQLVSNESADIVRMLPVAFAEFCKTPRDLYPDALRPDIDRWNDLIYSTLNNGVYRAGFARTQHAYDEAVADVFDTLDAVEQQLSNTAFLAGDVLTEADVRLFPTLARFDIAYHVAFKCCKKRIIDYPHLWRYARRIYAEVRDTVRFDIYRAGYFSKSELRNPLGIIPIEPEIDWSDRGD